MNSVGNNATGGSPGPKALKGRNKLAQGLPWVIYAYKK